MCDSATAQRRLEELTDEERETHEECWGGMASGCLLCERNIFAALNAACLSEEDEEDQGDIRARIIEAAEHQRRRRLAIERRLPRGGGA